MLRRRSLFPILLAFCACGTVNEDLSRQLLKPPPGWLVEPADAGIAAEPFEIVLHSEASLTGFWLPNAMAQGRTVVLFHDADTNASVVHPYYTFLHEQGFQVLVFDPRGFGRSKGTPTLQAWIYDLPELFTWLRARADVDPQQIAFFGTGWGSIAALWAARTQGPCAALVLENLPSPRDIVREANGDDGSMLSALSTGMLEFAGMPDDIEPVEGAPRTKVPALFLCGEFEPVRDRLSLLRAFSAYAGDKHLWWLPGTRLPPHGMVTHDGEWQRQIGAFLQRAFAGNQAGVIATATKSSNASDGQAWYEIQLRADPAHAAPMPIEACAVLADGSAHYAQTMLEHGQGRVRVKLPAAPAAISGIAVAGEVVADPERVFVRVPSRLSASAAAIEPLLPRIEALRNGALSAAESSKLADALSAAEASTPFHPRLCAELADVFALLGTALQKRPEEARRRQGTELLQRAIAAVPEQPALHVWPGAQTTYGFPQAEAVAMARRLLAAPPR